mmetsp:Transcript_37100/g.96181  ORF Transcript_37100/g.96181 Transcript_37100/m.96181 type:complete len:251 (-) Transcript_37100:562-1314(-)
MVAHQHLSFFPAITKCSQLIPHCFLHSTEVDGEVRSIRNETAIRPEYRARKVKALLHIGRHGRTLQCPSTLFSYRHEAMRKDGKLDRVKLLRYNFWLSSFYFDEDISFICDDGNATFFHHDCRVLVHNQSRAFHFRSSVKGGEVKHAHLLPPPFKVAAGSLGRLCSRGSTRHLYSGRGAALADSPRSNVVHAYTPVGQCEAKLSLIPLFESAEVVSILGLHRHHARIRAFISKVEVLFNNDASGLEALLR